MDRQNRPRSQYLLPNSVIASRFSFEPIDEARRTMSTNRKYMPISKRNAYIWTFIVTFVHAADF